MTEGKTSNDWKLYSVLKASKKYMTEHEYRTLKGQLRAGDSKGAMMGLHKILNRDEQNKKAGNGGKNMSKHPNLGRIAQILVTLGALNAYCEDCAADMPSATARRKMKCIATYTSNIMKELFESLPMHMRKTAEYRTKSFRIDIVPKTQVLREFETIPLKKEEIAELLRADPMECVACERTGDEMRNCPFRQLSEKHGLEIICEQSFIEEESE